jgi:hypothetical protein
LYQWYKDGAIITGTNTNKYQANEAGTYKAIASADVTVTLGPLTSAKWTEILTNIDSYLTGDGVLDLSYYNLCGSSYPLNDTGVFDPEVDSGLLTQAEKVKTF